MILVRNTMPQLARSFHICMHDYISACSGGRAARMKHNDISAVAAVMPREEFVRWADVPAVEPQQPKPLTLYVQTILLKSAIKRAAAQAERLRRLARIAAGTRQRFLN